MPVFSIFLNNTSLNLLLCKDVTGEYTNSSCKLKRNILLIGKYLTMYVCMYVCQQYTNSFVVKHGKFL